MMMIKMMRKIKWELMAIVLVMIMILGACKPAPTSEPEATTTPTVAPTEKPAATLTSTPDQGETGSDTVELTTEAAMCQAYPLPTLPVVPVNETDHVKGASAEDAKLVLFEYSDFQCPGCSGMASILGVFLEEHPEAQLVYRHFPLSFHELALLTAEASEAAGAQGKFWDMHDLLFAQVGEWEILSQEEARAKMSGYAEQLGLDVERFDQELDDGTYAEKVQSDYQQALTLGLPGTPTFIFDNVLFPSDIGLSYQGLEAFLSILENQDDLFFDAPPEMAVNAETMYEATLKTTKGDIVVQLMPESAPTHVNSFVFLAEQKWYDGSDFFFVQDNFAAVTGDPSNSTIGYPGYYCQGEETGVFDSAGLMGMLSNGQFFITLGTDAAQLTGQFALVGQVTEGLEVLDALTRHSPSALSTSEADILETVDIVEK